MIVGLTGGIGSGKSLVLSFFKEEGVFILEADQITRALMEPGKPILNAIVEHFGKEFLNEDGTLNRGKLREVVFQDPKERVWLENLVHPEVKVEILNQAKKVTHLHPYVMVEIPLLFEANFQDAVDRILVVEANEAVQIQRVTERDRVSVSQVEAIIRAQISKEKRLGKNVDVIQNEGSIEALREKVQEMHQRYQKLAT